MTGLLSPDVAAPSFWIFVLVASCILTFAADSGRYRSLLATLNLAFCALAFGPVAAGIISITLLSLHWIVRVPVAKVGRMVAGILMMVVALLFAWHKLPTGPGPALPGVQHVLAGLGFSYLALRVFEYLRGVMEDGHAGLTVVDTVNYLVPFHMLAAGPIVAFADFKREPGPRTDWDADAALLGVERIARGLFKKFVIANGLLATLFLTGFQAEGAYGLFEMQVYYLFIFIDFSAYTDIAVGIGRLIGVRTPENFDRPLSARNIIQFWERWHITLSQFIRRNIFVPLQMVAMRASGGEHPLVVASCTYLIAFVLCGLWHGLSVRFLVWGGMHALAVIVCNLYRHLLTRRLGRKGMVTYLENPVVRVVASVITFEFVAFSLAFIVHPATGALA